jgi:hypothetical protein
VDCLAVLNKWRPRWVGTLATEAASITFLWLLMVPMTADGLSALLASSISVVLYNMRNVWHVTGTCTMLCD